MSRPALRSALVVAAIAQAGLLFAQPALAVDARAEAAAKAALKKAAASYLATNFAAGAAALDKAVRACGASRCTPASKAAVLRDLGTMQLLGGGNAAAAKSFAAALALEPDIELNPDYDVPNVRAAWEAAQGGGSAEQPSGDFTHTPPVEQKVATPLPLYVKAPADAKVARVIVKYKGPKMSDWARLDLKRMGDGWAGMLPCADVTSGTMRYWVQGFDGGGDPVASSGDPKHPYTVPIRDEISADPPHLPGRPAPGVCQDLDAESAHARPTAAPERPTEGKEATEAAVADETGDAAEPRVDAEKRSSGGEAPYARLWLGLAGTVDFMSMPAGTNLCKLGQGGGVVNASNLYCTNPDGTDFPGRTSAGQTQNNALITTPPQAGTTAGAVQSGNVRAMLTLDYALSPSWLVGGRFGYVLDTYPGQAAVKEGRAFGAKFMFEARATYLFGRAPLTRAGFAPVAFAGLGLSEFDTHATTVVTMSNVAGQQPVDIWRTGGPFYVALGGGARYQFSPRAAFTAGLRLNAAVGGTGLLLTYGPEIGIQYGF